jgi:ankyrin repeat protein
MEVVRLLLSTGADTRKANGKDRTPISIANDNGCQKIVKLLHHIDP